MPAIFKNNKRYSSCPSIPINDGAISNNSAWSSKKTSDELNKIVGTGGSGNIVNIHVEDQTLICKNVTIKNKTLIL